jgi:phosphomannomutase
VDSFCVTAVANLDHLPKLSSELVAVQDYAPIKMMTLSFKNGLNITFRASGTEPKLKFYSQMGPTPVSSDPVLFLEQKEDAQIILVSFVNEIINTWILPDHIEITLA